MDQQLPEWVQPYVTHWRQLLYLEHISIGLRKELFINNDPDVMAAVSNLSAYNHAHIRIRADVEDDDEWRQAIIHEMLHIAHARIDELFRLIIERLGPDAQAITRGSYEQVLESFIDSVAYTLHKLDKTGAVNERSQGSGEDTDHGPGGAEPGGTESAGERQAVFPGFEEQRKNTPATTLLSR